ncbi:hypothetical protein D9615_009689 [Tricholomella constricta]|uniref:CCHC-type domain-containing protein n=1 Tax=Tricholomella constricta TaxID=117010 RepID=A0A8H5GUX6_9AGAR|nr:hypothetical protein D9615_009689 [Tricholomella constricta]
MGSRSRASVRGRTPWKRGARIGGSGGADVFGLPIVMSRPPVDLQRTLRFLERDWDEWQSLSADSPRYARTRVLQYLSNSLGVLRSPVASPWRWMWSGEEEALSNIWSTIESDPEWSERFADLEPSSDYPYRETVTRARMHAAFAEEEAGSVVRERSCASSVGDGDEEESVVEISGESVLAAQGMRQRLWLERLEEFKKEYPEHYTRSEACDRCVSYGLDCIQRSDIEVCAVCEIQSRRCEMNEVGSFRPAPHQFVSCSVEGHFCDACIPHPLFDEVRSPDLARAAQRLVVTRSAGSVDRGAGLLFQGPVFRPEDFLRNEDLRGSGFTQPLSVISRFGLADVDRALSARTVFLRTLVQEIQVLESRQEIMRSSSRQLYEQVVSTSSALDLLQARRAELVGASAMGNLRSGGSGSGSGADGGVRDDGGEGGAGRFVVSFGFVVGGVGCQRMADLPPNYALILEDLQGDWDDWRALPDNAPREARLAILEGLLQGITALRAQEGEGPWWIWSHEEAALRAKGMRNGKGYSAVWSLSENARRRHVRRARLGAAANVRASQSVAPEDPLALTNVAAPPMGPSLSVVSAEPTAVSATAPSSAAPTAEVPSTTGSAAPPGSTAGDATPLPGPGASGSDVASTTGLDTQTVVDFVQGSEAARVAAMAERMGREALEPMRDPLMSRSSPTPDIVVLDQGPSAPGTVSAPVKAKAKVKAKVTSVRDPAYRPVTLPHISAVGGRSKVGTTGGSPIVLIDTVPASASRKRKRAVSDEGEGSAAEAVEAVVKVEKAARAAKVGKVPGKKGTAAAKKREQTTAARKAAADFKWLERLELFKAAHPNYFIRDEPCDRCADADVDCVQKPEGGICARCKIFSKRCETVRHQADAGVVKNSRLRSRRRVASKSVVEDSEEDVEVASPSVARRRARDLTALSDEDYGPTGGAYQSALYAVEESAGMSTWSVHGGQLPDGITLPRNRDLDGLGYATDLSRVASLPLADVNRALSSHHALLRSLMQESQAWESRQEIARWSLIRWSRRASATPSAKEAHEWCLYMFGKSLGSLVSIVDTPRRRSSDPQRTEIIPYRERSRKNNNTSKATQCTHGSRNNEGKKPTTQKLAPRRCHQLPRDAQGRFLAFRDQTPALSPPTPTTDTSRSESPDSYGFGGRSPTAPTSPPPIPISTASDDDMPANVEPFWGDRPKENGQDFFRAFNRAMGDKADDVKCKLFINYLHADSEADEWYAALPQVVRDDWDAVVQEFHARWPRATVARKTAMEYEEEILALQLKEDTMGLKETVAGREVYTHIAWADKMGALVSRAGHMTGSTYIGLVRRGLPSLIRDRIVGTPANWTTFLAAVRAVDIDHIRNGAAELRKERERQKRIDERMRTLEAMSSPTRAIRTQLAHTSIAATPQRSRQITTTDANPFLTTGGGQGNLSYAVVTPTAGGGSAGRGGGGTGARTARPPPTEADRMALRARIALMVHHPDTEAGRVAHQAQQHAWIEKYGANTRVTELTPYPLRPGTLPTNSNECFGCGQAGHIAPRCPLPADRKLNIREADWRAICRSILRVVFAAPVRYVVIDDYGGVAAVEPSAYIEEIDESQGNGEGPSD